MSEAPPILCRWDGDAFVPVGRFARTADDHYVVGENYQIVQHQERSSKSHRHYFAAVNDAWASLPEGMGDRFPTPDHLRKFALIRTGYCDERTFVAGSRAEAVRLAAFLRPVDDFAVVEVQGTTVVVRTAKTQNMRAMDKAAFTASKNAVLDYLADLIAVEPGALAANAGRAA